MAEYRPIKKEMWRFLCVRKFFQIEICTRITETLWIENQSVLWKYVREIFWPGDFAIAPQHTEDLWKTFCKEIFFFFSLVFLLAWQVFGYYFYVFKSYPSMEFKIFYAQENEFFHSIIPVIFAFSPDKVEIWKIGTWTH